MDRDRCIGCPLDGVVEPTPAILRGSARFLVVTDTPTEAAARRGLLLSRNSAEVFAAGMAAAGFQPDDFSYVAQIRCCFDEGTYTTTDRKLIARKCREHLVDDIVASRPEVIMPLGASAASQVAGRAVKITKVKGVASHNEEHECMVLPLLSPGQVVMYPQHTGAFNADCISLKRLVDSEYNVKAASESMLGDYELIDDLQFLIDMEPTIIAFDTENTGLDYFHRGTHDVREYDPAIHTSANFDPHAAILTMQFCVEPGKAYLLPWDHPEAPQSKRAKARLKRQLTQLLCRRNVRVIGQNLKYDVTYLYHQTGIRLKIGGDTLMLAAQVDENLQNKNLDALVKIYVPELAGYADHFNATVDKSRMWEQPLHRLVGYGAGDADAALRVYKALIKIVQADKGMLANYRHVSLPGLNAFASMELRGVPVDYEALLEFEKVMAASVAEQEANLLRQVPNSIKRLHVDKGAKKGESGCKFSRSAFVQDILFKHPDGFRLTPKVFTKTTERLEPAFRVPSTSSKDHLPYFFEECPFTQELATYVKDERLLNTSVRGFKNKYIFDDLVRSIYSLWTAVTGRSASERPNGQNYPKRGKTAKAYRRIFVAPEGYFVLEADLSQAELRIAADMSRDPVMCRIYQEAGDIHTATALIIMGVTAEEFAALPKEVRSDFRTKAKATNFGFCHLHTDMVLCLRNGKPLQIMIRDVCDTDMVWDGVEWVAHEGKIYQGERACMWYDGYAGTPDHQVFISDSQKTDLFSAARAGVPLLQTGAGSRVISIGERAFAGERQGTQSGRKDVAILDRVPGLRRVAMAVKAAVGKVRVSMSGYGSMDKRPAPQDVGVSVRFDDTTLRERDTQVLAQLQGEGHPSVVPIPCGIHQMGAGYMAERDVQGEGVRQDRQRRALLPRQLTIGYVEGEQAEHQKHTVHAFFSWGKDILGRLCGAVLALRFTQDVQPDTRGWTVCGGLDTESHRGSEVSKREVGDVMGALTGFITRVRERCATRTRNRLWRTATDYIGVQAGYWLRVLQSASDAITYLHEWGGYSSKVAATWHLYRSLKLGDAGVAPTGRIWMNLGVHPTYDLINAGPRHRFTVNGRLVSNCYGMWWRKFVGYAKTQYGVEFTDRQAEKLRSDFFRKYAKLVTWHEQMKAFARKHKFVRSYSGRVRHLPMIDSDDDGIRQEAERQAVNSPVQGFGSDLGIMTLGRLNEEVDDRYLAPIAFVHDAIYALVPKKYLLWGARTLKWYMESNPLYEWFGTDMMVPIVADVSFGRNFGDTYEMAGLTLDDSDEYDFSKFWDAEKESGIIVPTQSAPPNNGALTFPVYTVWEP